MDELLDMIIADESPAQISDKIKDILFAKSAEKRPEVSSGLFGEDQFSPSEESEEEE
jgi:hypothetical protein